MLLLCFCSPVYEDSALNELAAISGARFAGRPAPGVLLLSVADSYLVEERVAAQPPIFTRQMLIDITKGDHTGDPDVDATTLLDIPAVRAGGTFACDADGKVAGAAALLRGAVEARRASISTSDADPLLAVLINGRAYVGRPLWGAGLRSAPRWPAGRPDLPYEADLVSRSALKLLEALALFAIPFDAGMAVLDLGAAPGGWTQVLARRGARVTAVDPGVLDPRVAAMPGVGVRGVTAQTYLRDTRERFDLIVNDMRLDARESARIMVAMAALLETGGWGVITLKLPQQAPTTIVRQTLAILDAAYVWSQARCLFFNRHEVTVCVRR